MEKRACRRVAVNIDLALFFIDNLYSGSAQNVSEKGVCFSTPEVYIPHGSLAELLIPLKRKLLRVDVRVNRLSIKKGDTIYLFMGADVLLPSKEYVDFVKSFRPAMSM